jgi:hypothetical protein
VGAKVDFKRVFDGYQARIGQFRTIELPPLRYLMIDGRGDPDGPAFSAAIEAIYPVAYKLKFASKTDLGRDYVVPPLEALWWAQDMDAFTAARDKKAWEWTAMLLVPEWIEAPMVDAAAEAPGAKNPPARLGDVSLEPLAEGRCVQTLHLGPFDEEGPVIERMHREFVAAAGLRLAGKHHEIYLSDPRRTAPARLRTILRQPVAPA